MSQKSLSLAWSWRNQVANSDLQSSTKLVLLTLSLFASESGEGVFPSVDTLVQMTSLSKSTVVRHLALAHDKGWITKEQRAASNGRQTSNLYTLCLPEVGEGVTMTRGRVSPRHPRGCHHDTPTTLNSPQEQSKKNKEDFSPEVLDVFNYWAERRHVAMGLNGDGPRMKITANGRGSAIKARLREGYTPEQLKKAVDAVLASDYHLENGYTDITLVCRNQAKVEQYLAQSRNSNGEDWAKSELERLTGESS